MFTTEQMEIHSNTSTHLLFALARLGQLGPHLLDVLEHHVAVAVEGLDARQQLLVVAAVDEHLGVVLHRLCEHRERARVELLLLHLRQLLRVHLGARLRGAVSEAWVKGSSILPLGSSRSAASGRCEGSVS